MAKTKERDSPLEELRRALDDQGYVLHLSTERKGETITAKLELQNLEAEKSLMKLVASGRLEDIDLTLGLDLKEEELWNFLLRLMGVWDAMKGALPVRLDTSR